MGERPLDPPHLSLEGMDVLQTHGTLSGVANVRHHVQGLDRIRSDHVGDGRRSARERVVESPNATSFVHGQSPAMGMDVGVAATAFEPPGRQGGFTMSII